VIHGSKSVESLFTVSGRRSAGDQSSAVPGHSSGKGVGRKCDPGHHDHPIGNLGCEPRPGNGLHLLRWRLMPPLGMWEVVGLRPVDFVD
jgi:hypothetical protein